VAVVVPRLAATVAKFRGLGTLGNSQPSKRAKKHVMLQMPKYWNIVCNVGRSHEMPKISKVEVDIA